MVMQAGRFASIPVVLLLSLSLYMSGLTAEQAVSGSDAKTEPETRAANEAKKSSLTTVLVAKDMIGKKIMNPEGETLGEIEDIALDKAGDARFVVLSHGGFLDIGDKLIAIPYEALKATQQDYYLLDMSKERLAEAPTLAEGDWSLLDNEDWNRKVFSYYRLEYPPPELPSFAKLDLNQDGYINEQEAAQSKKLQTNFAEADSNDDDRIDKAEFSAFETQIQTQIEEKAQ